MIPIGINAWINDTFVSKLPPRPSEIGGKSSSLCPWFNLPLLVTFGVVKPPCWHGYYYDLTTQICPVCRQAGRSFPFVSIKNDTTPTRPVTKYIIKIVIILLHLQYY